MRRNRYSIPALLLTLICFLSSPASGFEVPITSSMNPVGSGARALGMGGAFIGVADDATAASWNPAGLIQLETPELSAVGAFWSRRQDDTYLAFPEASEPHYISAFQLNYLSLALPFNALGTNFVASLNYQHLFDFSSQRIYDLSIRDSAPPPLDLLLQVNEKQQGSLKAISPALAMQLTPFLSFGLTVNIWQPPFETNKWKVTQLMSGSGDVAGIPFTIDASNHEENVIRGVRMVFDDPMHWQNINFNLGLLWEINQMLSAGAVFKSPFEASMQQQRLSDSTTTFPAFQSIDSQNSSHPVELSMPMSYGLGLAMRFSDAFTVDLDVYRTEWGDYLFRNAAGQEINPLTGALLTEGHLNATTQIRLGAEYLLIGNVLIVPLRAGLFYDPEPATNGIDDFFGCSLGSGLAFRNMVCDLAYEYRFGNSVREKLIGGAGSFQDIEQHKIYLSMIYHF